MNDVDCCWMESRAGIRPSMVYCANGEVHPTRVFVDVLRSIQRFILVLSIEFDPCL